MTPTFNSFFSGVSLDITPQIGRGRQHLLHIHPLVSDVQNSPLHSTSAWAGRRIFAGQELDQRDRHHGARAGREHRRSGGLMQVQVTNQNSVCPGFRNPRFRRGLSQHDRTTVKKELVILLSRLS